MSDDEQECASCHSKGIPLEFYEYFRVVAAQRGVAGRLLCALCAGTHAGNAEEYPDQYRHERNTMRTICYVGNEILKALKARS